VIPHLPGWLATLAFAIPVGPLVFSVTPHVTGGTLASVGVSLKLGALSAIVAAILVVIIHNLPSSRPPAKVARSASVVVAFIMAINDHNWPRVWQLGGKNLGTGEWGTLPRDDQRLPMHRP
jgi:hypothetical protein